MLWAVFPFPLAFHYVWRVLVEIPVFGPPPFLLLVARPVWGLTLIFPFLGVITTDVPMACPAGVSRNYSS